MRISDRLVWVKLLWACINAVTDWSEMKTCQTGLLSKSMFFKFLSVLQGFIFQIFTRKTDGMTNNLEGYDGNSVT